MTTRTKNECPHLWEGAEYGTECCALCGATAKLPKKRHLWLVPAVLLIGCGSGFSTSAHEGADSGSDAGGAVEVGTGGARVLLHGTGGEQSTGGRLGLGSGGSTATGGSPVREADSGVEADSAAGTGGTTGTGGSGTGGGVTGMGGSGDDGGALRAGGTTGAGGSVACTLVTHDNGIGQTWQDCVPLNTYDLSQAMKACKASGATRCANEGCVPGNVAVIGFDMSGTRTVGVWGYGGPTSWSFVCAGANCSGCPTSGPTWN